MSLAASLSTDRMWWDDFCSYAVISEIIIIEEIKYIDNFRGRGKGYSHEVLRKKHPGYRESSY